MKHRNTFLLSAALASACLVVGCKSQAQIQAEAAAKAADDKVAALEKQLAEAKGVSTENEGHADLKANHIKALEKQIADAKGRAETRRKAVAEVGKSGGKTELVDVPVGTVLSVKLAAPLATDKAKAGEAFEASLAEAVVVNGKSVWPAGAVVKGVVTQSVPTGRLSSGEGVLSIKVTEVAGEGVETELYAVHGDAKGTRNATYIGGGAALGALVGALIDKNHKADHALGGAAVGAAAGTAAAAATADTVIRIETAKPLNFKLSAPEKILVKK